MGFVCLAFRLGVFLQALQDHLKTSLLFRTMALSGVGPFQSKALEVFSPPRWFRTAPDVLGAVGNMSIAGAIICPRCGTLQCCAILSPNSSLKMGSGLVEKLLQTMDNQLQRIPFPAADGVRASLMSESKFQWKNRSPAGFGVPLGWGWPGTQDRGGLGEWEVKGLIGL